MAGYGEARVNTFPSFNSAVDHFRILLKHRGQEVNTGHWQAKDVSNDPDRAFLELLNISFAVPMAANYTNPLKHLQQDVRPNLPWAEDHFQERVSGVPHNPPPSYVDWPHYRSNKDKSLEENEKFSHTYPERFWPRFANEGSTRPNGRVVYVPHNGIRYAYGDLDSVIDLLGKYPHTRQAYLPIFFPEDTGAEEGQRIPCTLGYHFIMRGDRLHVNYYIRSCDLLRHFRDDIYMAVRLAQHVLERLRELYPDWKEVELGVFTMHITSLHIFMGDARALSWRP